MEEEKKRNGAEIKSVATITIVFIFFFSLFYFYNQAIRRERLSNSGGEVGWGGARSPQLLRVFA